MIAVWPCAFVYKIGNKGNCSYLCNSLPAKVKNYIEVLKESKHHTFQVRSCNINFYFKVQPMAELRNAYALKTPRVVALPFIYGGECIIIFNQNGKKGRITVIFLSIEVFMCSCYNYIYNCILSRASEVWSPTNHLGSGQGRDMGQGPFSPLPKEGLPIERLLKI